MRPLVSTAVGGFLLGSFVAAVPCLAEPPSLTASLDTSRVTLGAPFHLRLRVEHDVGARTLFPEMRDAVSPLVLRSASALTVGEPVAGRAMDERVYEMAAFQLDIDAVPAVDVAVVAAGDTVHLSSSPLPLEVVAVRQPQEGEDLRDIKPPVHIGGGWPGWLVGVVATVVAIVVALMARHLWRRREAAAVPAPSPGAPVDYAREFARVASLGLLERGDLKPYYTRLAQVMRRFLEDVLALEALERTTEEIDTDLSRMVAAGSVSAAAAARIVAFLQAADLVKFARALPPEEEARQAVAEGRAIVATIITVRRAAAAVGVDTDSRPAGASTPTESRWDEPIAARDR